RHRCRGGAWRRGASAAPDLPGRAALEVERLERLQILERVDAAPEAGIGLGGELLRRDEPLERLDDQLLAGAHVVEDLVAQCEEAAIDPGIGAEHILDRR